jgi:poly-gamma-glutamate synthase PgsB/CapB
MDGSILLLLGATTLVLVVLGCVEAALHRRCLDALRVRVHVNGTRGKSSVTRLIAAGLRAGGLSTCAKTTGTSPRLIRPDGREEPVYRVGPPHVGEQREVVRRARQLGAEALVLECMALEPFLQWVSAAHLVRPTHGVITNVRADHLDVMGPTTAHVARALAGSIPYAGRLYTTPSEYEPLFTRAARDRGTELISLDRASAARVTTEELSRFRYVEHAENVALALAVCGDLGVPRDVALRGMQRAEPDPGALTIVPTRLRGQRVTFVNGFAANDPESTEMVWELAVARSGGAERRVALVNCRGDRPERSQQLGQAVARWTRADSYVVIGTGTSFFTSAAERAGLSRGELHVAEHEDVPTILTRLAQLAGENALVVGLGNIGGVGLELVAALGAEARSA